MPHRYVYQPRVAVLVVAVAFLTSQPTASALAAGTTGLPVIVRPSDAQGNDVAGPGYFDVTAAPGSTTQLYALVGNKSREKAVISLVPVDAATGVYGGVTATLVSQPRRLVGRWIHLSRHTLTLAPNKGNVVPFTLTVPRGMAPGQYVGALTAFVPAQQKLRGRGFALTVQTRLADDVVVTVPGPQSWKFQLMGVSAQRRTASTYLIVHIKNTGSMMLKGWGYLWLWQSGRQKPVLAVPLHLDTTLPHTMVNYPLQLGTYPRPGRYAFLVKVWWNGGHTLQQGRVHVR